MLRFPKKEADIIALAERLYAGLRVNVLIIPASTHSPAVSEMEDRESLNEDVPLALTFELTFILSVSSLSPDYGKALAIWLHSLKRQVWDALIPSRWGHRWP